MAADPHAAEGRSPEPSTTTPLTRETVSELEQAQDSREGKGSLFYLPEGDYAALEREYRREVWLNHGHTESLYGDDGEMQCVSCPCDYKRATLEEIRLAAVRARIARVAALIRGKSDD